MVDPVPPPRVTTSNSVVLRQTVMRNYEDPPKKTRHGLIGYLWLPDSDL